MNGNFDGSSTTLCNKYRFVTELPNYNLVQCYYPVLDCSSEAICDIHDLNDLRKLYEHNIAITSKAWIVVS